MSGPSSIAPGFVPPPRPPRLPLEQWVERVRAGDRNALSRAITLMESTRPADRIEAQRFLDRIMPDTGRAYRIGLTGTPGAGKSTLIESWGQMLINRGHKVAVLAVDPSSWRSGGSLLGDKTRMPGLAASPHAYIRPSPSARTLGGVGAKTRETLLLCEAAGFDVVVVETVGVGQSEAVVAELTDTLVVLLIAGAGDSLQGIKRGVLELADVLVINKADGDNLSRARQAAAQLRAAVKLLHPPPADADNISDRPGADGVWLPPVLTLSAATGTGLDEFWATLQHHRHYLNQQGRLEKLRAGQAVRWMWSMVREGLNQYLQNHPRARQVAHQVEVEVEQGRLTPNAAATAILAAAGLTP
ncbi:LAO/AO transport system ATPase [Isosphaera pallida ATCC 43644]|uniref:LAO/AO transport system ATPase n=1 Tax=Isosphaera pallida (strain ATCC 43644 / DSM 9630 / IS1B) TaxID=575540 RepID=E8QZM9_ISOPI|nr:methylmalonyl Co-A mutase-associated GTPase MeaB [Isosphaera pallida]ADV62165.1 LAO/AO transport system ATPase [Isosphaera pallida ATCC 43644]